MDHMANLIMQVEVRVVILILFIVCCVIRRKTVHVFGIREIHLLSLDINREIRMRVIGISIRDVFVGAEEGAGGKEERCKTEVRGGAFHMDIILLLPGTDLLSL